MSKLVEDLKKQHTTIIDALNNVKSLGVGSEEGQKTLLAMKNNLLEHLNEEDNELYAVLKKAAENNSDLKNTLHLYAKDMDEISKSVLKFFEKYSTDGLGAEFAGDFGRLWMILTQRIKKEERVLYKIYEKLV